jgi:hypothetical protein
MDTRLIQEYGEDILCYRLRTARQRKRMLYEDFDKKLIQLYKEEKKLYQQKRNLGWQELNPPVQKGWVRYFVLRDDVGRNRHADFFESILKKINTYEYSWRKDFKKKKRKRGRKIYVVKPQSLLRLYEYQFNKMQFNTAEKQFFREVWELDWRKKPVKRYEFVEPWRYVLKIKPYLIDKVRIKDSILEARIQGIQNYLERNDLRGKQVRLLKGSWKRWRCNKEFEKYNEVNQFRNKSLLEVLDLIKQEVR